MLSKYINPFTGFGFKKLFGEEVSKDLLMDFLNQLLPSKHRIAHLTYKQSENLGSMETDRRAIFDIYCESESGEKFIVELQKAKVKFFKDRTIFYSTFPIREQAQKGNWDFQLPVVYCIAILDFVFDEHKNKLKYIHRVVLKDDDNDVFYEKLNYVFIEMPKFLKTEEQLETHFDKWLYLIKNLERFQQIPSRLQEKIFLKVFEKAEIARFNPAQMQAYENSLKYYLDLKNALDTKFEEGRKEGIEEGIKKGREELTIEMAKNMLRQGIGIEAVIAITQLSREQIEQIRETL